MCADRMDGSGKTILLLSDDPSLQTQIEQALGLFCLSSTVRWHPDLQQFQRSLVGDRLQVSQEAQVDLFMVAFPDDLERSVATLIELRRLKRHSLTPVIVFQNREDKAVTRQLYHGGANTVVKYPLNYEAIKKLMTIMDDYWFDTVSLPPKQRCSD